MFHGFLLKVDPKQIVRYSHRWLQAVYLKIGVTFNDQKKTKTYDFMAVIAFFSQGCSQGWIINRAEQANTSHPRGP